MASLLDMARELVRLHQERHNLEARIYHLEQELSKISVGEVPSASSATQSQATVKGFRKPTLDILALFDDQPSMRSPEVIQRSRRAYGRSYSDSAVRSSLRRLWLGGLLDYNGFHYSLKEKEE